MTSFEMDPVTTITAGAVGEPGNRIFYLQARMGNQLVTLLAEKAQIQALAITLTQLLDALSPVENEGDLVHDEALELAQPLLPEWRVGAIRVEIDDLRDLIVIEAEEIVDEDSETVPSIARFVGTRAQMRALGDHASEICAAGRPRCQLCGFPIDPEGHACPATNGHRKLD